MFDQSSLITLGFTLFFAGVIIMFLAVFLLLFKALRGRRKAQYGGIIMIGPIPIIFGTNKESVKILLILAIVLITLVLIFTAFSHIAFSA